jgi:glycosyltransferase involved in cell wall biosynthesis
MMNKEYPKVLIISRAFRAGDAITTLNLFSKWPNERRFCTSFLGREYAGDFNEFYLLGKGEVSFRCPFNLCTTVSESGVINCTSSFANRLEPSNLSSLRQRLYERVLRPTLQYFDLYETRLSLKVSKNFREWIEHISPDIIYTSVGDIPTAHFILELHRIYPNIKIAVHGFDDWLSPTYKIIREQGHRTNAEKLLKAIIEKSSFRFTSSAKMAIEYKERYGVDFFAFPNPVHITNIGLITKNQKVNIVFVGKVGWHNDEALRDMITAVEHINRTNIDVIFQIYTSTSENQIASFLGPLPSSTKIMKSVPNSVIPSILAKAHILYLPISINKYVEKFTRYSMSTKMGEYMSSGTPFIYYGPKRIAMAEFLLEHNCATVITNRNISDLEDAIKQIIEHGTIIQAKIVRARKLADKYFDIESVASVFSEILSSAVK